MLCAVSGVGASAHTRLVFVHACLRGAAEAAAQARSCVSVAVRRHERHHRAHTTRSELSSRARGSSDALSAGLGAAVADPDVVCVAATTATTATAASVACCDGRADGDTLVSPGDPSRGGHADPSRDGSGEYAARHTRAGAHGGARARARATGADLCSASVGPVFLAQGERHGYSTALIR